jgi:hypothetical protein
MPGYLIPADLDRLIPWDRGTQAAWGWCLKNLRASSGARVLIRGEVRNVPTIVLASREDGSCVFLENDRCTVHDDAPFGCAFFNLCDPPHEHQTFLANEGLKGVIKCWINAEKEETFYCILWAALDARGLTSKPPEVKRIALAAALDQLEQADAAQAQA